MKRITIIAIAAALFASTAVIALADDADVDTETSETRELSDAQLRKIQLLADYVVGDGADPADTEAAAEELTSLRTGDTVIGWGAMFKLLQLAKATDTSLADLLADIDGDEDGWAFGRRFKELDLNPGKPFDDAPKNLGQLKKQDRESNGNGHGNGNQGKKP